MNLGSIWAEIRIKTDQLQADVAKAQQLITAAEKNVDAAASKVTTAAQTQMATFSSHMETVANKIKATGQNISKIGTPLLIAGAAMTAAIGLLVKAAAAGEVAETRLTAALKATSQYSEENVKSLIRLSESMADLSGISHDAIQQMMGFGLQLGFSVEQVEKLTPKLLDFAAATGTDLETSIKISRAAMEGNTGALSRYGIYVEKAKDGTVDFNTVLNAFVNYAGSAKAKGETLNGQIAILKERFDRLAETLGTTLIPIIKDLIDKYLLPLIDKIIKLPPQTLENIIKFTALAGVLLTVGGTVMKLTGLVLSLTSSLMLSGIPKAIIALLSLNPAFIAVGAALAVLTGQFFTAFGEKGGIVGVMEGFADFVTAWSGYIKDAFDFVTGNAASAASKMAGYSVGIYDPITQKTKEYYGESATAAKMSLDAQDEMWNKHKTHVVNAINTVQKVIVTTTRAGIDLTQRAATVYGQITSEQIDTELAKLALAQQQKERQAWINAATEKLALAQSAKNAEEEAAVRKEIQQQYDAWQYEDTVDSLTKRKNLLDAAAQKEIEIREKITNANQKATDLIANFESNLTEYLKNLHQREMDFAIKSIEKERDAKLKSIQKEMDAAQKQYDDTIDKINEEKDTRLGILDERIAALQKSHELEARTETRAELVKAVVEAQTPAEKAAAQKTLNKQIAEWAYEDKIEELRKEGDAVRASAEEKAGIATKDYEENKKVLEVKLEDAQKYYDDQLTATTKFYDDLMLQRNLDAEAQKLLAGKTNTEILAILRGTKTAWAALGSEIGDAFWGNLMSGITNLKDLLKLIGELPIGGGHGGFAEGGAVYGPTLALLGENATPGNPEIIIPPGAGGSSNIEFLLSEVLDQMRTLNTRTMPNVRDGIADSISGLGRKA